MYIVPCHWQSISASKFTHILYYLVLCAGSISIAQHLFPIYIVDINEYQSVQGNKKASKNNTLLLLHSSSLHLYGHTQVQNTADGNSERTYQKQIKSNLESGKIRGGKTQLENLPLSTIEYGYIHKGRGLFISL